MLSWLGWCGEHEYDGPKVPAWAKRMAPPGSETPARSKMVIDRLIARRNVHLQEKTLWRMLYETVARSEEILGVSPRDVCPETGLVRLSYGQARMLLDEHTALGVEPRQGLQHGHDRQRVTRV
ncbi:hypothetical protein [Nonomuraea sp. NEAU-A123]|uniref:hypothetical protein n=1 Tax=Nonomuraea sp. NEAU-A123 TaxID=2839649 RepID=UPI001BE4356B|nr:hypothetical protein [Nonomuraea sp. NEAU-A123]MBT2234472.1 hypothetical protein [Nonomuraea sp. NEAU-A123]